MKQKLIFAAHQCCSPLYFGMNEEQTKAVEDMLDAQRDKAQMFWGGFYLHGKLEDMVGYDIATLVNQDEIELEKFLSSTHSRPFTHLLLPEDGEYECEVVGVNAKCIGFFWRDILEDDYRKGFYQTASNRGLICLANDYEAISYARQKLAEKSVRL